MTKKRWPAEKVENKPISELVPYATNARTHSDEQVAQIAASMNEWGWTNPILIDEDGMIIAGHGRVLAARKLGIDEVPVMTAHGWTEAQKKAYVLADNQLALNAEWDFELIGLELEHLEGLNFNVGLIGFDAETLSDVGLSLYDGGMGEFPELSDADADGFQQMTFILHETQVEVVKDATSRAKAAGCESDVNDNSNGNALASICQRFIGQ